MSPFSTSSANLQAMAQAIGRFEGFNVPGSKPQRTNNPGDIGTYGDKTGSYPTPEAGWDALTDYITEHAMAHPDWDFYDFFHYYLTGDPAGKPGANQDPDRYAEFVAQQVGVDPATPVWQVVG